jgi:hypothetical protein
MRQLWCNCPSAYPRECYDSELRSVFDDTAQGWVPCHFWANCPELQLVCTATYDVQLHNGTWAFEYLAKAKPASGYQFQEIGKPYWRYWHQKVVKLRLSGEQKTTCTAKCV